MESIQPASPEAATLPVEPAPPEARETPDLNIPRGLVIESWLEDTEPAPEPESNPGETLEGEAKS